MDTLPELIYQAYTEFNFVETPEFKAIMNTLDQTLRSYRRGSRFLYERRIRTVYSLRPTELYRWNEGWVQTYGRISKEPSVGAGKYFCRGYFDKLFIMLK